MAESAELRTVDFPVAGQDRRKPDRNGFPWYGVLLHSHLDEAEAVDHVLAGEMDDHRLIDRQHELVDGGDVVLGSRIGSIETEGIVGAHELRIDPAELTVRSRIMNVPRELLRHDTHDGRLTLLRE